MKKVKTYELPGFTNENSTDLVVTSNVPTTQTNSVSEYKGNNEVSTVTYHANGIPEAYPINDNPIDNVNNNFDGTLNNGQAPHVTINNNYYQTAQIYPTSNTQNNQNNNYSMGVTPGASNQSLPLLNDSDKTQNNDNNRLIRQILERNPFLFDDFPDNKIVLSIEDFTVKYKDNQFRFGDVIRKKDLPKRKKKKVVKNCFKEWEEEVATRLENDSLIGEGQFENTERKNNIAIKIGVWPFIIAIIMLVVSLILIAGKVNFFGALSKIELLGMSIAIPLILGIILLGALLNRTNNQFNRINKYSKEQYNKKWKNLKKDFTKKYGVTFNYYKNSYKGVFKKSPLPINKTSVGGEKFYELENLVNNSSQMNQSQMKKQGSQKFVKGIVKASTIIVTIFVLSDTLFRTINGLINLIKNR